MDRKPQAATKKKMRYEVIQSVAGARLLRDENGAFFVETNGKRKRITREQARRWSMMNRTSEPRAADARIIEITTPGGGKNHA